MAEPIYFMGLDLSLKSTGIIILDSEKKLKHQQTVKTKQKDPTEKRMVELRNSIQFAIANYASSVNTPLLRVFIEDYVPHATNKQFTLGGCHYVSRILLFEYNIPFSLVRVEQLKIFATDSSGADKDDMVDAAHDLGYGVKNDDEADALFLALMCAHWHLKDYDTLKRRQIEALLKTKTN